MLVVVLLCAAAAAALVYAIRRIVLPPPTFPKNIPTIPFYYALIPLFQDCDQEQLYRRYLHEPLATHGAVNIFFGGRWNILVQRPSFMFDVFKREDVYAKSGNQVKIPHGVLAQYTGDNIISSHGANWRLYASIVKPGLQRHFASNAMPLWRNANRVLAMMLAEDPVVVPPLLQRYTLANLSECLLEAPFGTLDSPQAPLHALQSALKPLIFNPIFLNFPFLDRLPSCLLPSRRRVRELTHEFHAELVGTIRRAHAGHAHDELPLGSSLGCRLLAAREAGELTETQFTHNCVSVFLAGHENPQLLLTSALFLLAEHPAYQARLRAQVRACMAECGVQVSEPSEDVKCDGVKDRFALLTARLASLPLLTATIYETLRLYPPISQLINRRTTRTTSLDGSDVLIPAGTYVGYHAYSTSRDAGAWGADAGSFRPERWGHSVEEVGARYRRMSASAAFTSFHGGRRACLGQRFAMVQARISLAVWLAGGEWALDAGWERRMTAAGPLYPRMLRVRVSGVSVDENVGEC